MLVKEEGKNTKSDKRKKRNKQHDIGVISLITGCRSHLLGQLTRTFTQFSES